MENIDLGHNGRRQVYHDGVQMRCKGVAAEMKDKDIERYMTAMMMYAIMSEVVR